MIAHIGIPVSDIEISKKFYAQALNPIGYQLLREYNVTPARPAASAGFDEPPRAETTANRDYGGTTAPIIMEPSSSIPTVTTLKRCAERRSE